MRSFIRCAAFSSIVVLLASSCKTMHGKDVDPVSDLERAVSHDGTVLFAVNARPRRICMFSSTYNSQYHHHKDAKLVTVKGAISAPQLKSALRFMGYGEQLITTLGVVAFSAAAAAAVPAAGTVVAITVLVGGTFGYRVIRGTMEGEKYEIIAGRSIVDTLSLTIFSPLNEYFHRSGRLEAVISDKQEITFTTKRMGKLLNKLAAIDPQFPRGCDHFKEGLQQH